MRINWRNVAVLTLIVTGLVVFYSEPTCVMELLIPDHYDHSRRPDRRASLPHVAIILMVIGGAVLFILDQKTGN